MKTIVTVFVLLFLAAWLWKKPKEKIEPLTLRCMKCGGYVTGYGKDALCAREDARKYHNTEEGCSGQAFLFIIHARG